MGNSITQAALVPSGTESRALKGARSVEQAPGVVIVPPTTARPWAIERTGGHDEVVVSPTLRLPAGPVLPPKSKSIAMRRSGAAIAGALLSRIVRGQGPVAWCGGKFLIYISGAFRPQDDALFRETLMSWDGLPIGTSSKTKLSMSKSLAGDALSCLRDMLAAPTTRFFADTPYGIAFTTVFVAVSAGQVTQAPHSPANRARHWVDVDYRPGAACRRFDRFLREVMAPAATPNSIGELFAVIGDAEAKIRTFWEWLGVALLGHATKFGKALLLWGPGGSGKSTLLMIVAALWPDELRSSFPLQALEDKFNRAELAGKLMNICGELPAADADVVETAKAIITGRDDIYARHPYERGFSFRSIAAHLIAANRLPQIGDFTGAFFERFIVLRAERKFRDTDDEDHHLGEKIIRAELGAIAARALALGAEAIRRGRIKEPGSSRTAIAEWQSLSDSVRAWVGELCELDTRYSAGGIAGDVAYRVYRVWAEQRGYKPFANNKFAEHLKVIGVPHKPSKYGTEWGLRWRDPNTAGVMVAVGAIASAPKL